jgi:hypothetical protein
MENLILNILWKELLLMGAQHAAAADLAKALGANDELRL